MKLLDHMVEMLRLQFTYRLYIYNTLSVNTVFIFMWLVILKLFIEQETAKLNGIQINFFLMEADNCEGGATDILPPVLKISLNAHDLLWSQLTSLSIYR